MEKDDWWNEEKSFLDRSWNLNLIKTLNLNFWMSKKLIVSNIEPNTTVRKRFNLPFPHFYPWKHIKISLEISREFLCASEIQCQKNLSSKSLVQCWCMRNSEISLRTIQRQRARQSSGSEELRKIGIFELHTNFSSDHTTARESENLVEISIHILKTPNYDYKWVFLRLQAKNSHWMVRIMNRNQGDLVKMGLKD